MGILRTVTERATRGLVFRRRLPATFGRARLYVAPDAALKYLKPGISGFDAKLLAVAAEFVTPGMAVWDVGANVGVFSVAAAARSGAAGRVLAVEPDVWLAGVVRRSATANPQSVASIDVVSAAVSDATGLASFTIAARGRASNALESVNGRSQAGGARERVWVPTVTADSLLNWGRPHLVKIDVEGAELLVLAGAKRLLAEVRPVIYIETGMDYQKPAAHVLLEAGYVLIDPAKAPAERKPLTRCSYNTIAMPKERWQ